MLSDDSLPIKGTLWWAIRSLGDCWPWGLAIYPPSLNTSSPNNILEWHVCPRPRSVLTGPLGRLSPSGWKSASPLSMCLLQQSLERTGQWAPSETEQVTGPLMLAHVTWQEQEEEADVVLRPTCWASGSCSAWKEDCAIWSCAPAHSDPHSLPSAPLGFTQCIQHARYVSTSWRLGLPVLILGRIFPLIFSGAYFFSSFLT